MQLESCSAVIQHLSEKMQFLCFFYCQVVQKHWLGEVGNELHFDILIVYFLSSVYAKNYPNGFHYVKVIASRVSDIFFEIQCINKCTIIDKRQQTLC